MPTQLYMQRLQTRRSAQSALSRSTALNCFYSNPQMPGKRMTRGSLCQYSCVHASTSLLKFAWFCLRSSHATSSHSSARFVRTLLVILSCNVCTVPLHANTTRAGTFHFALLMVYFALLSDPKSDCKVRFSQKSDSAYLLSRGVLMAKVKAESRGFQANSPRTEPFKRYAASGAAACWQHDCDRVTCRVQHCSLHLLGATGWLRGISRAWRLTVTAAYVPDPGNTDYRVWQPNANGISPECT